MAIYNLKNNKQTNTKTLKIIISSRLTKASIIIMKYIQID